MLSRATMLNEAFPDTVSTTDAARRAGLTYRQLHYWMFHGVVKPAFGTGGSGNPYRMTERQVKILVQIGYLCQLLERLDVGPQMEFIRRVWDALEETGTFRYTDGPLVITLPWPADALDDDD